MNREVKKRERERRVVEDNREQKKKEETVTSQVHHFSPSSIKIFIIPVLRRHVLKVSLDNAAKYLK